MSRVHICNVFFEKELELVPQQKSLLQWLRSHPVVLQLQFLPLIYAGPDDIILVSDLPTHPDPRLCLLENAPKNLQIEHWGPSIAIANWAKKEGIPYQTPPLSLIRELNSKAFSFLHSPKLPGSSLLHSWEETQEWIAKTPNQKVLKTPFGTAGNGHVLTETASNVKQLYTFPLIGEPWVERVQDFSTQWENGKLIGVTVFKNEKNGTYQETTSEEVEPWALEKHLEAAKPLISKMFDMGYSGNVGVDAFIYLWNGEKRVHPIVEINGRKTMSWVALNKPLTYTRSATGLLPSELIVNNKTVRFSKNLNHL